MDGGAQENLQTLIDTHFGHELREEQNMRLAAIALATVAFSFSQNLGE